MRRYCIRFCVNNLSNSCIDSSKWVFMLIIAFPGCRLQKKKCNLMMTGVIILKMTLTDCGAFVENHIITGQLVNLTLACVCDLVRCHKKN